MLKQPLMDKLASLRLQGMIEALDEQRREPEITQLDFEERLALLVERQWLLREDRAYKSRLQHAGFKIKASLEEVDYRHPRGLKRAHLEPFRSDHWILHQRNCLIVGKTGLGKSFISCAVGHEACRKGYRVIYRYAPKLFRELKLAHADGSLLKLLKKLASANVLVVDDLGIAAVSSQQYRDLLEVLEDRAGKGATVVTSQLPVNQWHPMIGDDTVADAILDRLVHNAYRIELEGESMRKSQSSPSGN